MYKLFHKLTPILVGVLLVSLPASICSATICLPTYPDPEPQPTPTPNTGTSGEFISTSQIYEINLVSMNSIGADYVAWAIAQATVMNGGVAPTVVNLHPNLTQEEYDDLTDLLFIQPDEQPPLSDN